MHGKPISALIFQEQTGSHRGFNLLCLLTNFVVDQSIFVTVVAPTHRGCIVMFAYSNMSSTVLKGFVHSQALRNVSAGAMYTWCYCYACMLRVPHACMTYTVSLLILDLAIYSHTLQHPAREYMHVVNPIHCCSQETCVNHC